MKSTFPDWGALSAESAATALPRLLEEAERKVSALEKLKSATFDSLVRGLDDAVRELWDLWAMVSHMTGVMNSPEWRKTEETFQPKIVSFSLRVGQSKKIFSLMKNLSLSLPSSGKGAVRRRIVEKYLQNAERAGVALSGAAKERFNAVSARLAQLATEFSNEVIDATKSFSLKKGGKTYTIDDANYPEAMKHCADRSVREKLFRARSARAGKNARRIPEILRLRAETASLLGYDSYADFSIASKCAPSLEAVRAMIDDLDRATAPFAREEERELAIFASSFAPLKGGVKPWDKAFLAERLRERKYAYSEEELKKHCEFSKVLSGLFRLSCFLFGVRIREKKGSLRPPVWHKDVRFFEVSEKGSSKPIAHFYLDPYVRSSLKRGGAWMNEFRSRSVRGGKTRLPLAVICTNFPEPDDNGKTFLPMREVETLFHEFGHALQSMLSRVDEEGASGLDLVEWDAVEVASQFMENWCLDPRAGLSIPGGLKKKVMAAKNFRAAAICRRQLAFSAIDLDLHSGTAAGKSPDAVKRSSFRRFAVAYVPEDRFLCSFTHIFAGGYAAGYYGYKWAEVMSADCYGAFEEAGLGDDAALRRTGERYRKTLLALGGSLSALDVFKAFRGRPPRIDALLRASGLVKDASPAPAATDRRVKSLRGKIDVVDAEIIALLKKRFSLSSRMRALKSALSLPPVDPLREKEIISKAVSSVPSSDRDTASAVYEAILRGSRGYVETIARGVVFRGGKVLLCRAKGSRKSYLPGGHVDFGETAREALEREMLEECGLEVKAGKFLAVVENTFMQDGKKHSEINLVYEMSFKDRASASEVVSREDWISFEWRDRADLARAALMPVRMRSVVSSAFVE